MLRWLFRVFSAAHIHAHKCYAYSFRSFCLRGLASACIACIIACVCVCVACNIIPLWFAWRRFTFIAHLKHAAASARPWYPHYTILDKYLNYVSRKEEKKEEKKSLPRDRERRGWMTNANLKCIARVSTKNYAKYVISLYSRKLRDLFEEITASRLSRTFFKNTTHSFFIYLLSIYCRKKIGQGHSVETRDIVSLVLSSRVHFSPTFKLR